MLAVYKIRFQIEPAPPETLQSAARECLACLKDWVEKSSRKSRLPFHGIDRSADLDPTSSAPHLRSASLLDGAFFHSFSWRKPDPRGGQVWVTSVDLVSDGESMDFQFALGVEATKTMLQASRPKTGRPSLIPMLLSHSRWRCRIGSQILSPLPLKKSFGDVDDLCDEILFAEDRELPVVVVTPGHRPGQILPVNPTQLAERLGGTARVVQMVDRRATQVLDQFLGRNLAIGPFSVRVFAPGLRPGSPLDDHWHFLGETILAKELSTVRFADFLFSNLAERSLSRFRESPIIQKFRKMASLEQARVLEGLRAERQATTADYEEYTRGIEEQNRQLVSDKQRLEELLEAKDDEIEQLRWELESGRENVLALTAQLGRPALEYATSMPQATDSGDQPETVSYALEKIAEESPDLLVLSSAHEAAEDVPVTFKFTERVAAALAALQEGAAERCRNGRIPNGWKKFFESKGLDYKAGLSDTAKNAYGEEYRFLYEGSRELFEEHFTIGKRSANTCLSIHFSTRLRDDKIVIAYVGRHLKNTQS
jgi:hypothetical protein